MIVLPEEQGRPRDFICPCGKGYFSYAALFTHVKQKHQGKVAIQPLSRPDRSSSPSPKTSAAGPRSPPPPQRQPPTARILRRPASPTLPAPPIQIRATPILNL